MNLENYIDKSYDVQVQLTSIHNREQFAYVISEVQKINERVVI